MKDNHNAVFCCGANTVIGEKYLTKKNVFSAIIRTYMPQKKYKKKRWAEQKWNSSITGH